MKNKSLHDAPASTLRWWGLQSADAFDHASAELAADGFEGPIKWSEGALVPYRRALTSDLQVRFSLSTFSAERGYATFDAGAVLYSRTLHERSVADVDYAPARRPSVPGFRPCLTISLAHLKWCSAPSDVNPHWAMTLANDTQAPGVQAFVADYRALLLPILDALDSDAALTDLLTRCLRRSRPAWVRSDPPTFARLATMVELMKTH